MAKTPAFAVGDSVRLMQPTPPQLLPYIMSVDWDGITPCKISEILETSGIATLKFDDESKIQLPAGFLEYAPFEVSKLN